MKTYVKPNDKKSLLPVIFVTIILLAIPIGIIAFAFSNGIPPMDEFIVLGSMLPFLLPFLGFGLFFVYTFFKRPRYYKAKLINKYADIYNGKRITCMEFNTVDENEQKTAQEEKIKKFFDVRYKCYTLEDNNYAIGNEYALKIKEVCDEPRYIEEINSNNYYKIVNNKSTSEKKNNSTILLILELIFGSALLFFATGIIMYPEEKETYIILSIICGAVLFIMINKSKANKSLELGNIKLTSDKKEKVSNTEIKNLFIFLILIAIAWLIFLVNLELQTKAFLISFSLISVVEIPIIIMIIYYIGYDKRLIKKHQVNIQESTSLYNLKYLNIVRATKSKTFTQYFIVDKNNNLILKVKKINFLGTKYAICDLNNIKVGEIKTKFASPFREHIVNINDETTFIVRRNVQKNSDYTIDGRNYHIIKDNNSTRNILYDEKEDEIAYISEVTKNSDMYKYGNAEIVINEYAINSIDITTIVLCIAIIQFKINEEIEL